MRTARRDDAAAGRARPTASAADGIAVTIEDSGPPVDDHAARLFTRSTRRRPTAWGSVTMCRSSWRIVATSRCPATRARADRSFLPAPAGALRADRVAVAPLISCEHGAGCRCRLLSFGPREPAVSFSGVQHRGTLRPHQACARLRPAPPVQPSSTREERARRRPSPDVPGSSIRRSRKGSTGASFSDGGAGSSGDGGR